MIFAQLCPPPKSIGDYEKGEKAESQNLASEICRNKLAPWSPVRWQSLSDPLVFFNHFEGQHCILNFSTSLAICITLHWFLLLNPVWIEEGPVYLTHLAGQVGVPEGLHQPQDLRDVPMNTRNKSSGR